MAKANKKLTEEVEYEPEKVKKHVQKRRSISTIKLMNLVAKSSGYHLYEVEDIVNHLVAHLQILILKDKPVKIDGLGTIKMRHNPPRSFYSPLSKRTEFVYTRNGLSISADKEMGQLLRDSTPKPEGVNNDEPADDAD